MGVMETDFSQTGHENTNTNLILYNNYISIFRQNFDFWTKFRFLDKISIFGQNFDFWTKFRFLTKISIFGQNFDFWTKF